MNEGFKVVKIKDDGRRVSATEESLPKDYVQTYIESDGTINTISTALIFSDLNSAKKWQELMRPVFDGEIWTCSFRSADEIEALFPLFGMNEIRASKKGPYDPDEMAALISGRATRIWPNTFDKSKFRSYRLRWFIHPGALVARDVRLIEKI